MLEVTESRRINAVHQKVSVESASVVQRVVPVDLGLAVRTVVLGWEPVLQETVPVG